MPTTKWPATRIAYAAFLVGKGYTVERIAADRQINSMPAVVRRRLQMVGLVPSECDKHESLVAVPTASMIGLRATARRQRRRPEELAATLLSILGEDEALLANVLDDEDLVTIGREDEKPTNRISSELGESATD